MFLSIQSRLGAAALFAGLSLSFAGESAFADEQKAALTKLDSGELAEAPYRIDIPADWNGELVMLLHGYEPKGFPRDTPWPQNEAAPVFLAQGYAVAASAYRSQGWAADHAIEDNERLRAFFADKHGKPKRTWLVGFSLGGHLALAGLEQHAANYDGALSLCGVNVPAAKAFDESILTSLVAFEHFFPGAMGLAAGGLADPESPYMLDTEALEAAMRGDETAAALLSKRLQVSRDALAGAIMLNNMVLREMFERAGGFPVDNRDTVYTGFGDDAAFNKAVHRYTGDADAVAYVARNADLSGRISKPVVLQSNNNDPTVPARFDAVYPALVDAAGASDKLRVLPLVGEGHCAFGPEEVAGAFQNLVEWVGSRSRD